MNPNVKAKLNTLLVVPPIVETETTISTTRITTKNGLKSLKEAIIVGNYKCGIGINTIITTTDTANNSNSAVVAAIETVGTEAVVAKRNSRRTVLALKKSSSATNNLIRTSPNCRKVKFLCDKMLTRNHSRNENNRGGIRGSNNSSNYSTGRTRTRISTRHTTSRTSSIYNSSWNDTWSRLFLTLLAAVILGMDVANSDAQPSQQRESNIIETTLFNTTIPTTGTPLANLISTVLSSMTAATTTTSSTSTIGLIGVPVSSSSSSSRTITTTTTLTPPTKSFTLINSIVTATASTSAMRRTNDSTTTTTTIHTPNATAASLSVSAASMTTTATGTLPLLPSSVSSSSSSISSASSSFASSSSLLTALIPLSLSSSSLLASSSLSHPVESAIVEYVIDNIATDDDDDDGDNNDVDVDSDGDFAFNTTATISVNATRDAAIDETSAQAEPPSSDSLTKGFSIPTFLPPFPSFAVADLPTYKAAAQAAEAAAKAAAAAAAAASAAAAESEQTIDNFVLVPSSSDSQVDQDQLYQQQQHFMKRNLTLPPINVTVQVGNHAYLPCHIRRLMNKPVSWVRVRDGHILSVDQTTFIADQRFQSIFKGELEYTWSLQIKYVQAMDEGWYECQVSTEPKMSAKVYLSVVVPKTELIGDQNRFVKTGSKVALHCIIRGTLDPPTYIIWFRGKTQITNDIKMGWYTEIDRTIFGNVSDNQNTIGSLIIPVVRKEHSGNYTCQPANSEAVSVDLHVLSGEYSASAIKSAATIHRLHSKCLILILLLFLILTKT